MCMPKLARSPVREAIAAVSVGIVEGRPMLDLCYAEDCSADVDLNAVMNADGRFIEIQGTEQVLWPDHCVQGTWGAMFHPDLRTDKIAAIFRKGMNPGVDSYSGFYDNRHKISTGLAGYLREKGSPELYFCGIAADICVYYTIVDAVREGFTATLIEDASAPLDQEAFTGIKKELTENGVKIINSANLRIV